MGGSNIIILRGISIPVEVLRGISVLGILSPISVRIHKTLNLGIKALALVQFARSATNLDTQQSIVINAWTSHIRAVILQQSSLPWPPPHHLIPTKSPRYLTPVLPTTSPLTSTTYQIIKPTWIHNLSPLEMVISFQSLTLVILIKTSAYLFNLRKVLHVPSMKSNLLSVQRFCRDNHCSFSFNAYRFQIQDCHMGKPLYNGLSKDGLYPIHGLSLPSLKSRLSLASNHSSTADQSSFSTPCVSYTACRPDACSKVSEASL